MRRTKKIQVFIFLASNETEVSRDEETREEVKKPAGTDRHLPRWERKCPASQGVLLSERILPEYFSLNTFSVL